MPVPASVARGMVRPGSSTREAGMVADSIPSMANSASVEAAIASPRLIGLAGGCAPNDAGDSSKVHAPSTATASIGTSFITVVTTCTRPPLRTPSRLTPTNSHSTPTHSHAGCTRASGGKIAAA